jgi:chromosomal replication initiation ATPase DnaA
MVEHGSRSQWQHALARLQSQLPSTDYATWIAPLRLLHCADGVAVVETPNVFVCDEVERRYLEVLQETLRANSDQALVVHLTIGTAPMLQRSAGTQP